MATEVYVCVLPSTAGKIDNIERHNYKSLGWSIKPTSLSRLSLKIAYINANVISFIMGRAEGNAIVYS